MFKTYVENFAFDIPWAKGYRLILPHGKQFNQGWVGIGIVKDALRLCLFQFMVKCSPSLPASHNDLVNRIATVT